MAILSRYWTPWSALTDAQLSPVVAGLLAEHTGWRNFWWLNVALLGAALFLSLLAFPETRWHHRRAADTQTETPQASNTFSAEHLDTNVKANPPSLEYGVAPRPHTPGCSPVRDGKPGKKQFNLFQANSHPLETLLLDLWTPIMLFAFPIVDFASLVVSWSASSFLTVNLTQSQAFAAPPYSYTPQTIGFFNFAVVIGGLLGLVTAGPLSDWITMRATKRNNGIREPEMRLPAMIPFTLIMILGNFVVGFGYQYHWDWRVRSSSHHLKLDQLPSQHPPSPRSYRHIYTSYCTNLYQWITSGNCHRRFHLWGHPSSIPPSHRFHLRN